MKTVAAFRLRSLLMLSSILALAVVYVGCGGGDRTSDGNSLGPSPSAVLSPGDMDLDSELELLLSSRSEGRGLAAFRLPGAGDLGRIPQDPQNPLTPQKIELGRLLYHETALAVDNVRPEGYEGYSCAACHHHQGGFGANLPQGIGEGGSGFGIDGHGRVLRPEYDSSPDAPDIQPIRSPSILNGAYQELMLWNGQFGGVGGNLGTEDRWIPGTPLESNFLGLHGLETQAHAGMAVHRMLDIDLSRAPAIGRYHGLFQAAFPGDSHPMSRLNCAFALAAFERTVLADRAPFQGWLRGNRAAMTETQKRGAVVFFGEGGCVECHTGPALNSMSFHALGMKDLDGSWEMGRVNLAPWGGTVPEAVRKGRGGFTGRPEDDYTFKTPQLYNLMDSPYYGHGASFSSVREVVEYLNSAVPENPHVPPTRLDEAFRPLGLDPGQITDLVAFVEEALYDRRLDRYAPKRLPSGNCFPVNDLEARADLGCR